MAEKEPRCLFFHTLEHLKKRRLPCAVKKAAPFPVLSLSEHHRQWTGEGIPILQAKAALPRLFSPHGRHKSAGRINRFYRDYLRAFYRFCAKDILPPARADFLAAASESRPLPLTEATLSSTVTYERSGIVSLYTDLTVTAPGRSFSSRTADTWDLKSGCPLSLDCFFPSGRAPKKDLVRFARECAVRRIEEGALFREDYRRALRRYFSARRFYLTDEGLVFFYPRGCAAPMSQGPLTFLVPYSETGPALPG